MQNIYITGTGFWIPEDGLTTNDEVVNSYNAFVDNFNEANSEAISAGSIDAMSHSSSEFIEKASGIKTRYLFDKANCLDSKRMNLKLDRSFQIILQSLLRWELSLLKKLLRVLVYLQMI